jgi:hypothetical protein
VVSYPFAGANIGGESLSAYQDLTKENPDYYGAALKGLGALGNRSFNVPTYRAFWHPINDDSTPYSVLPRKSLNGRT